MRRVRGHRGNLSLFYTSLLGAAFKGRLDLYTYAYGMCFWYGGGGGGGDVKLIHKSVSAALVLSGGE